MPSRTHRVRRHHRKKIAGGRLKAAGIFLSAMHTNRHRRLDRS
jgi:hypothetical protein